MGTPKYCLAPKLKSNTIILLGKAVVLTEIADKTGYDLSYLSRIFSGKTRGSITALTAISGILGITLDELMSGISSKNSSN